MNRSLAVILCRSLLAGFLASTISCGSPAPRPNVFSDDTGEAITGMKRAARSKDRSVVPELIKDLDSDDPAIRFYAIEALREITGEDQGYQYFQDEDERKPALERWRKWDEGKTDKAVTLEKKTSG